jgi:hypothetical protein
VRYLLLFTAAVTPLAALWAGLLDLPVGLGVLVALLGSLAYVVFLVGGLVAAHRLIQVGMVPE